MTSIPPWEQQQLGQLSAAGDLYGLNPVILEAIDQAESSGQGGGVNPEGYGGFFGLSANGTYPGGDTTPALLSSTTPQAFDEQAVIAASAFNEYLQEAGGNPIAAEEIYQSGSASGPTEGSQILQQLLGGASATGGPTGGSLSTSAPSSATLTGLNPYPWDLFGIPQTVGGSVASSIWTAVGPFLAKSVLVIGGIGLIILGLYKTTDAGSKVKQALPAAAAAAA